MSEAAEILEAIGRQLDAIGLDRCRCCGAPCGWWYIEPKQGLVQPWCATCCPDHDYEYDRYDRRHHCTNCNAEPPDDHYYQDDDYFPGPI